MKRILLLSLVFLTLGINAQTKEVTGQDILNMRSCYEKIKSHGLQQKCIDIDGEQFNVMSERDFARENIMVSDKEELQKISDLIHYEKVGINGKFVSVTDRKSMRELFGEGHRGQMLYEQATMSYSQEGTFQLMCHGISDQKHNPLDKISIDGKIIDAERTSKIILKEMEGYEIITKYTNRPLVVVLHACGVGGISENSFASQLSGYLAEKSPNIYVVAAPGNIYPVASWPYKEIVKDKNGNWVKWNCFYNGKFLVEGEKDFEATVTKIQRQYKNKSR